MTRDDVLRMAREAGIPDDNIPRLCHGRLETGVELLESFAARVAAAEREACAQAAEGFEANRDWVPGSLWGNIRADVAAAIRARGAA